MAFKDVLLAVTTYPEPTSVSAIEDPVDFAATIGAKISAIAREIKIRAPKSVLGNILLDIPAMVAAECKKSEIFWSRSSTLLRSTEFFRTGFWSTASSPMFPACLLNMRGFEI